MARSIHYTTKGVFRNQQPRCKRRGIKPSARINQEGK